MSSLFISILEKKRLEIFKKLSDVTEADWYLAGGTALALQIGHRKSYDFDVFLKRNVPENLLIKLNKNLSEHKIRPVINTKDELSVIIDGEIKITFFYYPFAPLHKLIKTDYIDLLSLKDLASDKVYVIGRRGEWKDYVDLYFLLEKKKLSLDKIIKEAEKRFKGNFDEKLFWEQLVFWQDLGNFNIDYLGDKVDQGKIEKYYKKTTREKFKVTS